MALPIYSTGTVAVAAGGTVVTLAGGMWSGINARQGDFISIAGSAAVLVTEVTDATHLKIAPWPGAAQTAAAYQIFQNYVGRVVGVAAAEDVGVMLEKLHVDGLPFIVGLDETVPDPSYGDDGQLAYKPDTGQWWIKTAGVWTLTGAPATGGAVLFNTPQTLTDTQKHQAQKNIGIHETLSANRYYFVRTDGNDGNDGLSNTPAGAFLTIQKAIDVATKTLDFAGWWVIIFVADGTYAGGGSKVGPWVGGGTLVINGNTTAPANCILNGTINSQGLIVATGPLPGPVIVQGFKFTANGGVTTTALYATLSAILYFDNCEFGAMPNGGHLSGDFGAQLIKQVGAGSYVISGSALLHWHFNGGSQLWVTNTTITLVGTPHFSDFFAGSAENGRIMVPFNTYVGAATGPKFLVHNGGIIQTQAALDVLPGDVAGDWYQESAGIYTGSTEPIDIFARGEMSWNGYPWTPYTPGVYAGSGAITAYTAQGRYKKMGKTVAFQASVTFTNPGTLAVYFLVTPPLATFAGGTPAQYGSLTAFNVTSLAGYSGYIGNNFYVIGAPSGAGQTIVMSGTYETSE